MKQTRACNTRFKQLENGAKLSLKPTPRNKRNKTKEKTHEEKTLAMIKQLC